MKAQTHFWKLLQDRTDRVPESKLGALLGIKDTDWIVTCCDSPPLSSRDGRNFLSDMEADRLLADLWEDASIRYVPVLDFAKERDVSFESLKTAIDTSPSRKDYELINGHGARAGGSWLFSNALNDATMSKLEDIIVNASYEHKADLTSNLSNVPIILLHGFAERILMEKGLKGSIQSEDASRLLYVSEAYEAKVKQELAKELAREFSKVLVQIHRNGYHAIPDESGEAPGLREVFLERTKAGVDDGSFSLIKSGSTAIAIAFTNRLENVVEDLQSRAMDLILETEKSQSDVNGAIRTIKLDESIQDRIVGTGSNVDFAKLVLKDAKYRSAIEEAMAAKAEEVERRDRQRCNEAFHEHVHLPVRLYLVGIASVHDATLKQHLDDFVLHFLRKDLIPTAIQHLREHNLLSNRSVARDAEKFHQTCDDAPSFADVQAAVTKFVRRQKLDAVSLSDEWTVKLRVLQLKLKSVKRMARASDVLQNLIWMALAQRSDGLFISSGKDTTRMIKQYRAVGDPELAEQLDAWKDKLKAGHETKEDWEVMRDLAGEIVEEMTSRDAS